MWIRPSSSKRDNASSTSSHRRKSESTSKRSRSHRDKSPSRRSSRGADREDDGHTVASSIISAPRTEYFTSNTAWPSSQRYRTREDLSKSRRRDESGVSRSAESSRGISPRERTQRTDSIDKRSRKSSIMDNKGDSQFHSWSDEGDHLNATESKKRQPASSQATRSPAARAVPNQFPGQVPQEYATSDFQESGYVGAAADYYGDHHVYLNAVASQPGVRPHTPIVMGTEPHLMAPLAEPAPPEESGAGSAADFYAGTDYPDVQDSSVPAKPAALAGGSNSSSRPSLSKPSAAPGAPSSRPSSSKPPKRTSSTSSTAAYVTGAAAVAGLGAASLRHGQHQHHHQHYQQNLLQDTRPNSLTYANTPLQTTSSNRRRKGAFGSLVDWWKDYEDVRKMEEYMEYIGVCKHCFDPSSSVWEAPRPHGVRRRSSQNSMTRTRVDKDNRYRASGDESRRKRNSSDALLATAGAVGAGLATNYAARSSKSKTQQNEYEDYSIQTEARRKSVYASQTRPSVEDVQRPSHSRHGSRQSGQVLDERRSSSQTSKFQSLEASGRATSRDEFTGNRFPKNRRSSSWSSSSSSGSEKESPGFFAKFFSPGSKKAKNNKLQRNSFYNVRNASTDTGLAYGHGSSTISLSRRSSKGKSKRRTSDIDPTKTLLALGGATAALAAAQASRGARDSHQDVIASRDRRSGIRPSAQKIQSYKQKQQEEGWESTSEDTDDDASIDSGLAFGHSHVSNASSESLSSTGSGVDKWNWRWAPERTKKKKVSRHDHNSNQNVVRNELPSTVHTSELTMPSRVPSSGGRYGSKSRTGSVNSEMKEIDPIPASEVSPSPNSLPARRTEPQPILRASSSKAPIQHPKPVSPPKRHASPSDKYSGPFPYLERRQSAQTNTPNANAQSSEIRPLSRVFTEPVRSVQSKSAAPERRERRRSDSEGAIAATAAVAMAAGAFAGGKQSSKSSPIQSPQETFTRNEPRDTRPRIQDVSEENSERERLERERRRERRRQDRASQPPAITGIQEFERQVEQSNKEQSTEPQTQLRSESMQNVSTTYKPNYTAPQSSSAPTANYEVTPDTAASKSTQPVFDDDIFDPSFFKKRNKSAPESRGGGDASKVFQDFHARYAEEPTSQADFFAPKEVLNGPSPISTREADFHLEDQRERSSSVSGGRSSVPRLNIIAPTPPGSVSGRSDNRSPSPSPLRQSTGADDVTEEKTTPSRVRWGDSEINVYQVESPESFREQEYFPEAEAGSNNGNIQRQSNNQSSVDSNSDEAPGREALPKESWTDSTEAGKSRPQSGSPDISVFDYQVHSSDEDVPEGGSSSHKQPHPRAGDSHSLQTSPEGPREFDSPEVHHSEPLSDPDRSRNANSKSGGFAGIATAAMAAMAGSQAVKGPSENSKGLSNTDLGERNVNRAMPGSFDDDDDTPLDLPSTQDNDQNNAKLVPDAAASKMDDKDHRLHGLHQNDMSKMTVEGADDKFPVGVQPDIQPELGPYQAETSTGQKKKKGKKEKRKSQQQLDAPLATSLSEPTDITEEPERDEWEMSSSKKKTKKGKKSKSAGLREPETTKQFPESPKASESVSEGQEFNYESVQLKDGPPIHESSSSPQFSVKTPPWNNGQEQTQGSESNQRKKGATDLADVVSAVSAPVFSSKLENRRSRSDSLDGGSVSRRRGSAPMSFSDPEDDPRSGKANGKKVRSHTEPLDLAQVDDYSFTARPSDRKSTEALDLEDRKSSRKEKKGFFSFLDRKGSEDTRGKSSRNFDFIGRDDNSVVSESSRKTKRRSASEFDDTSSSLSKARRSSRTRDDSLSRSRSSTGRRRSLDYETGTKSRTKNRPRSVPDIKVDVRGISRNRSIGNLPILSIPELIPLPDSLPSSPLQELVSEGNAAPASAARLSSSTAIPLRFRRPPPSPINARAVSPESSPAANSPVTPTNTRKRTGRPTSTEFKTNLEFRPLYLLESTRKIPATEENLPSLPSSHTNSRASSVHGSSDDQFESARESPSTQAFHDGAPLLHAEMVAEDPLADILGSGQTTPRAESITPAMLRTVTSPSDELSRDLVESASITNKQDLANAPVDSTEGFSVPATSHISTSSDPVKSASLSSADNVSDLQVKPEHAKDNAGAEINTMQEQAQVLISGDSVQYVQSVSESGPPSILSNQDYQSKFAPSSTSKSDSSHNDTNPDSTSRDGAFEEETLEALEADSQPESAFPHTASSEAVGNVITQEDKFVEPHSGPFVNEANFGTAERLQHPIRQKSHWAALHSDDNTTRDPEQRVVLPEMYAMEGLKKRRSLGDLDNLLSSPTLKAKNRVDANDAADILAAEGSQRSTSRGSVVTMKMSNHTRRRSTGNSESWLKTAFPHVTARSVNDAAVDPTAARSGPPTGPRPTQSAEDGERMVSEDRMSSNLTHSQTAPTAPNPFSSVAIESKELDRIQPDSTAIEEPLHDIKNLPSSDLKEIDEGDVLPNTLNADLLPQSSTVVQNEEWPEKSNVKKKKKDKRRKRLEIQHEPLNEGGPNEMKKQSNPTEERSGEVSQIKEDTSQNDLLLGALTDVALEETSESNDQIPSAHAGSAGDKPSQTGETMIDSSDQETRKAADNTHDSSQAKIENLRAKDDLPPLEAIPLESHQETLVGDEDAWQESNLGQGEKKKKKKKMLMKKEQKQQRQSLEKQDAVEEHSPATSQPAEHHGADLSSAREPSSENVDQVPDAHVPTGADPASSNFLLEARNVFTMPASQYEDGEYASGHDILEGRSAMNLQCSPEAEVEETKTGLPISPANSINDGHIDLVNVAPSHVSASPVARDPESSNVTSPGHQHSDEEQALLPEQPQAPKAKKKSKGKKGKKRALQTDKADPGNRPLSKASIEEGGSKGDPSLAVQSTTNEPQAKPDLASSFDEPRAAIESASLETTVLDGGSASTLPNFAMKPDKISDFVTGMPPKSVGTAPSVCNLDFRRRSFSYVSLLPLAVTTSTIPIGDTQFRMETRSEDENAAGRARQETANSFRRRNSESSLKPRGIPSVLSQSDLGKLVPAVDLGLQGLVGPRNADRSLTATPPAEAISETHYDHTSRNLFIQPSTTASQAQAESSDNIFDTTRQVSSTSRDSKLQLEKPLDKADNSDPRSESVSVHSSNAENFHLSQAAQVQMNSGVATGSSPEEVDSSKVSHEPLQTSDDNELGYSRPSEDATNTSGAITSKNSAEDPTSSYNMQGKPETDSGIVPSIPSRKASKQGKKKSKKAARLAAQAQATKRVDRMLDAPDKEASESQHPSKSQAEVQLSADQSLDDEIFEHEDYNEPTLPVNPASSRNISNQTGTAADVEELTHQETEEDVLDDMTTQTEKEKDWGSADQDVLAKVPSKSNEDIEVIPISRSADAMPNPEGDNPVPVEKNINEIPSSRSEKSRSNDDYHFDDIVALTMSGAGFDTHSVSSKLSSERLAEDSGVMDFGPTSPAYQANKSDKRTPSPSSIWGQIAKPEEVQVASESVPLSDPLSEATDQPLSPAAPTPSSQDEGSHQRLLRTESGERQVDEKAVDDMNPTWSFAALDAPITPKGDERRSSERSLAQTTSDVDTQDVRPVSEHEKDLPDDHEYSNSLAKQGSPAESLTTTKMRSSALFKTPPSKHGSIEIDQHVSSRASPQIQDSPRAISLAPQSSALSENNSAVLGHESSPSPESARAIEDEQQHARDIHLTGQTEGAQQARSIETSDATSLNSKRPERGEPELRNDTELSLYRPDTAGRHKFDENSSPGRTTESPLSGFKKQDLTQGQVSISQSSARPSSSLSNRSAASNVSQTRSVVQSLRRVQRSISSDLHSMRGRDKALTVSGSGKTDEARDKPPPPKFPTADYQPLKGVGKDRKQEMSEAGGNLEGWGAPTLSSPRSSPSRPPSIRKRQSTHILDLERQVEQLTSENRELQEGRARTLPDDAFFTSSTQQTALQARDQKIEEKDIEINTIKASLATLQAEVARLTRHNAELQTSQVDLEGGERYATLEAQHHETQERWKASSLELESLQKKHSALSRGMESVVREEIDNALREKDDEIKGLRLALNNATDKIQALQRQLALTHRGEDYLNVRDEDYFDSACQQLCQHVQQWVLRFSKFSDTRLCRLSYQVKDEKIETRLDNAVLDGSEVDDYLADRVRRRDVFMSVVMTMIWEFVFTRYLFGMDRDQRQKLKALEKTLTEVGPARAVAQWRATTLTLLSRRNAFVEQRAQDMEAVVQEIFGTLNRLLPPPSHLKEQIQDSLRNVMRLAVNLSIEMRTQRAEYIMLPPLQPEYDTNGDLARKVFFNASLMNERSGETSSNEELEIQQAVVRLVLFPLVVKKGNDLGESDEEVVVCPAQVLIARSDKDKKASRIMSGQTNASSYSVVPPGGLDPENVV